jgi:hypothetical protein
MVCKECYMYCRATTIVAAGIWATALFAQAPPRVRAVRPEEAAMRQLKMYRGGEKGVCSSALRETPVPRNLEEMPVLRPRVDHLEPMPVAKMPAAPCKEDKP